MSDGHEGMAEAYFPNGTAYHLFLHHFCNECRHNLDTADDGDYPTPSVNPPHGYCAWGIHDRIIMGDNNTLHPPEDIDGSTCPPTCKRFIHRDDGNGHLYDPPPADAPGQMTLGEIDVPVERVPEQSPELTKTKGE